MKADISISSDGNLTIITEAITDDDKAALWEWASMFPVSVASMIDASDRLVLTLMRHDKWRMNSVGDYYTNAIAGQDQRGVK